jgi:hypothetical protein
MSKSKITVLIILIGILGSVLLSFFISNVFESPDRAYDLISKTTLQDQITVDDILKNYFSLHTVKTNNDIIFNTYFTENDVLRYNQKLNLQNDIKFEFPVDEIQLYENLKLIKNTIVIYPIFTSAAYSPNGFYDYYDGNCDESCLNGISFENPQVKFTSSGISTQILHSLGYDFITDIDVDKNPEILKNYDNIILLHNEYVTQKQFDAITAHPHLIFLSPNALYAEIEVNYDDNTISLIRGHNYPPGINNGFNYEIEEMFHEYEYDNECENWEFIEIENGYHLNCYPDGTIHKNLDLLLKIKSLQK